MALDINASKESQEEQGALLLKYLQVLLNIIHVEINLLSNTSALQICFKYFFFDRQVLDNS